MSIGEVLAIWGASVSTLLAILRVWEWWSNRTNLSVHCYLAVVTIERFIPKEGDGWDVYFNNQTTTSGENPFVAMKVTNVGTKEVIVKKVGGSYTADELSRRSTIQCNSLNG